MKSLRTAIWIVLAAVFIAAGMVSCARTEMDAPARLISFQVARHSVVKTRADVKVSEYDDDTPFGAYAWYKGDTEADNTDFMTNEKVIFDGNVWKPAGAAYYWPKGGSLDFICYSPFSADSGPTVAESSISWTDWDIKENEGVDLMYATKAPGMTAPVTTYYYNGVPTLFHHALARVGVKLRLAYDEVVVADNDKTRWDVTVHSIKFKDIYSKGSLTLNLGEDGKEWDKPASNAWTVSGDPADITLDCSQLPMLENTELHVVGSPQMVLPQAFGTSQMVDMEVTIRTWRDNGEGYYLFLTESHVHVGAYLKTSAISGWGINQNITYTFVLAPSHAENSGQDQDGDGLEDQVPTVVYFDPAVDDWESIELTTSIQL